jgi:hypothetical protein
MKLTWVNIEEVDEPRWGERWSEQKDDKGEPLYKICLGKGYNYWRVTSSDGSLDEEVHTLAFAKSVAQDEYDNDRDCDGCGQRPYVSHVGDLKLCQECLAAITYEEEDEAGY